MQGPIPDDGKTQAEAGERIGGIKFDRSLESQRAAARFEPDATIPIDPSAVEAAEAKRSEGPATVPLVRPAVEAEAQEDAYTSRLLKAKKQVWRDRGFDPNSKNDS